MLQIEKIFEKVEPRNHSINGYINNKIRIKDNNFSIKSIYKMVEHFKWMRKNMNICETKIIIDSDFIADQAILTLMESIIFFVINEWKYNNKKIVIEEYNREYNKKITINGDHFRKICENIEENRKGEFISVTMDEVDIFLKCFELDNEYRNELAEVIAEIVDNALKHSNGDCILNLNDIFIGKEIVEYIRKEDKSEYSEKNKIVLEAYENHKNFFGDNYNINSFAMISAFQKYVTTRKMSKNTGGTGLTTLINALIEKSTHNFCYAISGNTNLIFKNEFLTLNENGLIGFNETNNYIEMAPNEKVVSINKYDMNVNIYNLQFILKENKDGK